MSLKQNKEIPPEIAFNLRNVLHELRVSRTLSMKTHSNKIKLIMKIIDCQTRLTGIFFRECQVKQLAGLKYDHNVLLTNALANQTYLGLSVLILLKQTLYGSARVLLRQFFEALLIAKYSEQDASLTEIWKANVEEKIGARRISVSRDVLIPLKKKGIDISQLKETWSCLTCLHIQPRMHNNYFEYP